MKGPSGAGLFGGVSSFFADNPLMGAWYEPGTLANRVPQGQRIADALIETGGAVAVGNTGPDGKPAFQLRKASGGYLSALVTKQKRNSPLHMHLVMRLTATPGVGDVMFNTNASTGVVESQVGALNTLTIIGQTGFVLAVNNQIWHLYDIVFWGSNYSFVSVDGGAYTRVSMGFLQMDALIFGAFTGGTNRSDCDIAFMSFSSGRSPYQLLKQRYQYLQAKFPSLALGLPAAYPGDTSTNNTPTQNAPAWGTTQFWGKFGQSNALGQGTTPSAAYGANIDCLDYTFNWLTPPIDPWSSVGVRDRADLGNAVGGFSGSPAFANAMQPHYGGQFTLVDQCPAGSFITLGPLDVTSILSWNVHAYEGLNTPTGPLGSFVSRVQETRRRGGNLHGLIYHQGEGEASVGTAAEQEAWPAAVAEMVNYLRRVLNLPTLPFIFVQLQPSPAQGAGHSWNYFKDTIQPQLLGLLSNCYMVTAPDGPYIASSAADHLHLDTPGLAVLYGTTIPALIAANNL